jgi:hypothetical protein
MRQYSNWAGEVLSDALPQLFACIDDTKVHQHIWAVLGLKNRAQLF